MALKPGSTLGRLEIVSAIGKGGMGEVYRARDTRLDRDVALKVLPEAFTADRERAARFEREARVLASLNHPNIGQIYGLEEGDEVKALVLELVEGPTLADRIAEGVVPLEELLPIGRQIAEALEAAHRQRVIHRDLKPANIKLKADGTVKVLDFGLAKPLTRADGGDSESPTLTGMATAPGAVVGTAAYMSPEQARGEPVDARTDLWSLGVVLYEMATGERPFEGRTTGTILEALLAGEPVPVRERNPQAGPELDRIVGKLLEKDRSLRYQTAAGVRADLERLRRDSGTGVSGSRRPPGEALTTRTRLRPGHALLVVLVVAVAATAVYFSSSPPESSVAPPSAYVQLTNFTDSATAPSLSPDGRMVAFIRGGQFFLSSGQIYVKLLPNGESVQLTKDEAPKYAPVFTPDGSRVAYTRVERLEEGSVSWDTWTVPVLGGEPVPFLPNASGLAWIDDERVLFSEVEGSGLHMGIVTATETRSERREIYFPEHERAMAHYSWASPDRQWVLVVEMDRTARWQPCRLVPFDGSSPGRPVGPDAPCISAAWSPDGAWMYFSAFVDGALHLWRQRFPEGAPEQITFGPTEEVGVAVAPDGRSAVTSVGVRQSSLWLHDADGDRLLPTEGDALAPQLSADGRRVYYLLRRDRLSPSHELRMQHLDSGGVQTVLPDARMRGYAISPDERQVVFTLRNAEGEPEVWLAPLDRRTPPRLMARNADSAAFGPEGRLLFRSLEEDVNFLVSIGTNGGGRERVSSLPILNMFGVSPDGAWTMAQVPGRGEAGQQTTPTVAIPTDGGPSRLVCPDPCRGRWSADGRFLYLEEVGAESERTLVVPLPPGRSLPEIPESGISVINLTEGVLERPGVRVIDREGVLLGPAASTYVYVEREIQRNLFRIPLP